MTDEIYTQSNVNNIKANTNNYQTVSATLQGEGIPNEKSKGSEGIYNCTYCKSSFTTSANMRRHELEIHNSNKPFICTVDGCGRAFSRKYDLKVHNRTHTNEKPYQCLYDNCGKRFSRVSSLREHERNIHGVSRKKQKRTSHNFQCSNCSKNFEHESELEEHLKTLHDSISTPNCEHTKPDCGHAAVLHKGHADFLIPDSSGVLHFQHLHKDNTRFLEHVPIPIPNHCEPSAHSKEHVHGKGCGHVSIKHGDHLDYLVDNSLHHLHQGPDGWHCDHHGTLEFLNESLRSPEMWAELLQCNCDLNPSLGGSTT